MSRHIYVCHMLQTSFRRVLKVQRFTPFFRSKVTSTSPTSSKSRTSSHNTKWETDQPARRVFRSHVSGLLRSIDSCILAEGLQDVENYIHDKISVSKFNSVYRSIMFNQLIHFLLERHLFKIAISVYNRMLHEQFLPSRDITLRMRGLMLVQENVAATNIVAAITQLFKAQGYTMEMLLELIHFLTTSTNASAKILDDLADAFISTRNVNLSASGNLVSIMVTACMRAGQMTTAERWLKRYESDCMQHGAAPDAAPYAAVLETLQEIQPQNSAAVQATLYRMRTEGVLPNISVFNTLIRSSLTRREYTEAFGLYHTIMAKRSAPLLPNDLTFKMLFRASKFLRQSRSRKHKRPENAVPPRQLFRDMVQCHLMRTGNLPLKNSNIISVSCLHLALRTFMAFEDYPAAIMTLRAIEYFGFRPNLQTYLIVITSLVLRIKRELGHVRQVDEHRFADFVMRMKPREPPNIDVLERRIAQGDDRGPVVGLSSLSGRKNVVGPETVTHLLSLGEPTTSSQSETSRAHVARKRMSSCIIPTVDMLMGTTLVSPFGQEGISFLLLPVVRIVRKALFAGMYKKAAGGKREGWDWRTAVRPILRSAKEEMWPEIERGLEVQREGKRGRGSLPFPSSRVRRMVVKQMRIGTGGLRRGGTSPSRH